MGDEFDKAGASWTSAHSASMTGSVVPSVGNSAAVSAASPSVASPTPAMSGGGSATPTSAGMVLLPPVGLLAGLIGVVFAF